MNKGIIHYIRNSYWMKVVTSFMLIEMLITTISPVVSYALTSGPNAPEYTSFEPVDVTDLVQTQSGDFTYTLPLFEVPGPEGGYPLALSYHAGIRPDMEASWVGLGWTLNPGAINRTVDGIADDFNGSHNELYSYWSGGTTKTFTVGVGVGPVGVGLTFANDTYKGFGMGGSVSLTVPTGFGGNSSPAGVSLGLSVGPYGGVSANIGLAISGEIGQAGQLAFKGNASMGLSTNFKTINGYGSMGVSASKKGTKKVTKHKGSETIQTVVPTSTAVMGVSMGTSGLKPSVLGTGLSISQMQSSNQDVTVNSSSWNVSIPLIVVPATLNLGASKTRYYLSQTEYASFKGALYPSRHGKPGTNNALDLYTLKDIDQESVFKDDYNEQENQGGAFAAYDRYDVSGQGVSGSMRPFIVDNTYLYAQDNDEVDYKLPQGLIQNENQVNFRFDNDFSNAYVKENIYQGNPANTANGSNDIVLGVEPDLNEDPALINVNQEYFNNETNHLAGSRHVEWFTNEEIANDQTKEGTPLATYGFMPYEGDMNLAHAGPNNDLVKFDYPVSDNIGAFMITNASGVTYHYALPVYAYDDMTFNESTKKGTFIKEEFRRNAYAYTWLLTSVTGPDFVDRPPLGQFGPEDWGYWTAFDYGKWTDQYKWRSPNDGTQKGEDRRLKNFSRGKKELYYLDRIRTRTHSALFVKKMRNDAKGIAAPYGVDPDQFNGKRDLVPTLGIHNEIGERRINIDNKINCGVSGDQQCKAEIDVSNSNAKRAGFDESNYNVTIDQSYYEYTTDENGNTTSRLIEDITTIHGAYKPVSTLALEEIIILKNEDLDNIITDNKIYQEGSTDVEQLTLFSALKASVKDGDNYVLQDNHTNFHNNEAIYTERNGEKTSISYDEYKTYLPHQKQYLLNEDGLFEEDPTTTDENEWVYHYNTKVLDVENIESIREELLAKSVRSVELTTDYSLMDKTPNSFGNDYLYNDYRVMERTLTGKLTLKSITLNGKGGESLIPPTNFAYGDDDDNPNFPQVMDQDLPIVKTDMWGFHTTALTDEKYVSLKRNNPDIAGIVSQHETGIDDWSLTEIETPNGAKIKVSYEADDYNNVVLVDKNYINIESLNFNNTNKAIEISFYEDYAKQLILKGTVSKIIFFMRWKDNLSNPCDEYSYNTDTYYYWKKVELDLNQQNWQMPLAETLYINDEDLFEQLQTNVQTGIDEYYDSKDQTIKTITNVCDCEGNPTNCTSLNRNRYFKANFTSPKFVTGVAFYDMTDDKIAGGGLRVKELSVETDTDISTTNYTYTGGSTPYEPKGISFVHHNKEDDDDEYLDEHLMPLLYAPYEKVYLLSRLLPGPGVLYNKVEIREKYTVKNADGTQTVSDIPGHKEYVFNTFHYQDGADDNMLERKSSDVIEQDDVYKKAITIQDYSSRYGQLKSTTLYNANGDPLNETTNHYLYEGKTNDEFKQKLASQYKNQGRTDQVFLEQKEVNDRMKRTILKRETYPSILYKTVITNHKTGLKEENENLAYDFITGLPTKVLSKNQDGAYFLACSQAAYHTYDEVGGMGLKIFHPQNKHMLEQNASSVSYKLQDRPAFDTQGNLSYQPVGIVNASAQTWTDQIPVRYQEGLTAPFQEGKQPGIWRKANTYTWIGSAQGVQDDGTHEVNGFEPFTVWEYTQENTDPFWLTGGEVTLFDAYTKALEAKDINGNYAATKMDYQSRQVMLSGVNTNYEEFAFSGAEYMDAISDQLTDVSRGDAYVSSYESHTGGYSLGARPGKHAFTYTIPGNSLDEDRTYEARVWVYLPNDAETNTDNENAILYYTLGNSTEKKGIAGVSIDMKAGAWYLLHSTIIPEGKQDITIHCLNNTLNTPDTGDEVDIFFDDFRVQPLDASATAYVYDLHTGELNYTLNSENIYTRYRYDAHGRLTHSYQELIGFPNDKLISKQRYNYARN